jgi:hypothetical protein
MTKKVKLMLGALCTLAVIGVGTSVYLYLLFKDTSNLVGESGQLVAQVGRIILLPVGENPAVLTVTDETFQIYSDQIFFTNAEVGDKILIYNNTKKAYLFRPSQNKIIEVSTFTLETTPQSQPES